MAIPASRVRAARQAAKAARESAAAAGDAARQVGRAARAAMPGRAATNIQEAIRLALGDVLKEAGIKPEAFDANREAFLNNAEFVEGVRARAQERVGGSGISDAQLARELTPEAVQDTISRVRDYMADNTATLPEGQRSADPVEAPQEGGVSYEPSQMEELALTTDLGADQPDVRGGSFDEPNVSGDRSPPKPPRRTTDSIKDLAAKKRRSGPEIAPKPVQGRQVGNPGQPADLDIRTLRLMDVGSPSGGRRRKMVGRQTIGESGDIALTDPVSGTLYYVGDTPVFLDESGRMLRFDSADGAPTEITSPAEFQLLLREAGDVQPVLANPLNDPVASERILSRLPQRAEGLDVEVIGDMLRAFDTADGLFPSDVNLENLRRVVSEMELRYAMNSDDARDALAEAFGGASARNPEQYESALQRGVAAYGRAREMLTGLEQSGAAVDPNRVFRDQVDYQRPRPGISLEPMGELSVAERSRPGAQALDEMVVGGQTYRRSEGGLDQLNELKAETGEEIADVSRIIDEIDNARSRGIDGVDFSTLEGLATKYVGSETGMGDVAVAVLEAIESRDISGVAAAKLFAQDRLNELNRLNAQIDLAFSGKEYIPERISVGPDGEVTGSTLGDQRLEGGTRFVMKGDGEFEPYSPEIHGELGNDGVTSNGDRTVMVTSSPDAPLTPAARTSATMPQAFSQARTVMAEALRSRGVSVPPALARVLETRPRSSRIPSREALQKIGSEIEVFKEAMRNASPGSAEYKTARARLRDAERRASAIAGRLSSGESSAASVAAESTSRAMEGWGGTQQEFLETQLRVNDPAVVEAFNRIDPSQEAPADLTPAESNAREYLQSQQMSAPEALNYLIVGRSNPELLRNIELLRERSATTSAREERLRPSFATRAKEFVFGPGESTARRKELLEKLANQRAAINEAFAQANQSPLTSPGAIETRLSQKASQPITYESKLAVPPDQRMRVGAAPARSPEYERFHALIERFGEAPLLNGFDQSQMDIAAAALSDLNRLEQSMNRPNASKLYDDYDLRRDEIDYLKDYFARGLEQDPSARAVDQPQPRPKEEPGQPVAPEPGVTPKVDATLSDKIAEYRARFEGVEDDDITSRLATLDELEAILSNENPRGRRVTGADRKRYVDEAAKIFRELNEYQVYDPRYDFSDVEMIPRNRRDLRLRETAKEIDGGTLYFPDRKTATAAAAFRSGTVPEVLPEGILSELEKLGLEVDRSGTPVASFQEYADGSKSVVVDLPVQMTVTSGQPGPGGRINPPAGDPAGTLAEPGQPGKTGSGSDALRRYINDQRAAGDLSARKAGGATAGIQQAKSIKIEIPAFEDLTAAVEDPSQIARAFALDSENNIRVLERDPAKVADRAARSRTRGTLFDPDTINTSLWGPARAEAEFTPTGESFSYEGTPFDYDEAPANKMPQRAPEAPQAEGPDVEAEMERIAREEEFAAQQQRDRDFYDEELPEEPGDDIAPSARQTEPAPNRVRSLVEDKAQKPVQDAPQQAQPRPGRKARIAALSAAAALPVLSGAATKEQTAMNDLTSQDPAEYGPAPDINPGEPVRELSARERIANRLAELRGTTRSRRPLRYGTTQLYTPNWN